MLKPDWHVPSNYMMAYHLPIKKTEEGAIEEVAKSFIDRLTIREDPWMRSLKTHISDGESTYQPTILQE